MAEKQVTVKHRGCLHSCGSWIVLLIILAGFGIYQISKDVKETNSSVEESSVKTKGVSLVNSEGKTIVEDFSLFGIPKMTDTPSLVALEGVLIGPKPVDGVYIEGSLSGAASKWSFAENVTKLPEPIMPGRFKATVPTKFANGNFTKVTITQITFMHPDDTVEVVTIPEGLSGPYL